MAADGETFEARINRADSTTHRDDPQAIGVMIRRVDRNNPHQPSVSAGLKAIMRDGKPHIFLEVNGMNRLTLIVQEDGTVTEHRGIPV